MATNSQNIGKFPNFTCSKPMKLHSILRLASTAYTREFISDLSERNAEKGLLLLDSVWQNSEVKELPEAELARIIYGSTTAKALRNLNKLASDLFTDFLLFLVRYYPWFCDEIMARVKQHVLTSKKGAELDMVNDAEVVFSKLENNCQEANLYAFLVHHYHYQRDYPKVSIYRKKELNAQSRDKEIGAIGRIVKEANVARKKKNKASLEQIHQHLQSILEIGETSKSIAIKREAYDAYLVAIHNLDKTLIENEETKSVAKKCLTLADRNSYVNTEFRDLSTAFMKQTYLSMYRQTLPDSEKMQTIAWFKEVMESPKSFAPGYFTFRWHYMLTRMIYAERYIYARYPDDKEPPHRQSVIFLNEMLSESEEMLSDQKRWQLTPTVINHLKVTKANLLSYLGKLEESREDLQQLLFENQQFQDSGLSHIIYTNLINVNYFLGDFSVVIELYEKFTRYLRTDTSISPLNELLNKLYFLIAKSRFENSGKIIEQIKETADQISSFLSDKEFQNKVFYVLKRYGLEKNLISTKDKPLSTETRSKK